MTSQMLSVLPDWANPIRKFDVESLRFPGERQAAQALREHLTATDTLDVPDAEQIRRSIRATALQLTATMAPEAIQALQTALWRLRIQSSAELYQSAGQDNAAMHLVEQPIIVELSGRMLTTLEPRQLVAVFGHELGHWLAHGHTNPLLRESLAAHQTVHDGKRGAATLAATRLLMSQEITADRFGVLATGDAESMLRLSMIVTTGLPPGALTWDTQAYVAQARELMESLEKSGKSVAGLTHPEHSLRAFAIWLFSQTDVFSALTGAQGADLTLNAVNERLQRLLGQVDRIELRVSITDEISEVHAVALASCCLIALADGELDEREREALEVMFAKTVPNWTDFLNEDIAHERFTESAALVTALTDAAKRSFANILWQMVLADGLVRPSEVAMYQQIGEVLGCSAIFESVLQSGMRAVTMAPESDDPNEQPPASPRLPVRRAEAEAALQAWLRGTWRRGEGSATIARLLALAGRDEWNASAFDYLLPLLQHPELQHTPALDLSLPTQTLLHFSLTSQALASRQLPSGSSVAELGPERQKLRRAVARLREKLVSGDGRSPSVRLSKIRPSSAFDLHSLEGVSVGMSERVVALLRDSRPVRLVDGADIQRSEVAARMASDLRLLERESRAWTDETGANVLYVGYPFICGVAAGYYFRAPLVLFPAQLVRDSAGARGFTLQPRPDEEPIANHAFVRAAFSKLSFGFDDSLSDRLDTLASENPEALLRELEQLGFPRFTLQGKLSAFRDRTAEVSQWKGNRFEIEEHAVLGLFPQSGSDLLPDYDGLLKDLANPELALEQVMGCAFEILPATWRNTLGSTSGAANPESPADMTRSAALPFGPSSDNAPPVIPVIGADPSQRQVIETARRARALVVDGPPGTGKSQVIVNLVADALGRGLKVAVVCEKRAAIDVVVQRLDAQGMRHLLAVVHDLNDDRKSLYGQIAARLESTPRTGWNPHTLQGIVSETNALENALLGRRAPLIRTIQGAGMSLGQLHELASAIPAEPLRTPVDLTAADDARMETVCRHVEGLRDWADLLVQGSVWRSSPPHVPLVAQFAQQTPQTAAQFSADLLALQQAAAHYETFAPQVPQPHEPVERALGVVQQLHNELSQVQGGNEVQLLAAMLGVAPQQPGVLELASQTWQAWQQGAADVVHAGGRVNFEPSTELTLAMPVLVRWVDRFLRFFVLAWWGARGVVRRALAAQWPERSADAVDRQLVEAVQSRLRAAAFWRQATQLTTAVRNPLLLPTDAQGAAAFAMAAGRTQSIVRLALTHQAQLQAASALPVQAGHDGVDAWKARLTTLLGWWQSRQALAAQASRVQAHLPWISSSPTSTTAQQLHAAWQRDQARVSELARRVRELEGSLGGATSILLSLVDSAVSPAPGKWTDVLVRTWAEAWIQRVEQEQSDVAQTDRPTSFGDEVTAEQALQQKHRQLATAEVDRILQLRDQNELLTEPGAEYRARRTPVQAARENMLKDARKQRNILTLRSFMRQYATSGLLDALPVWLLSPETLAVLFPREPLFDLIIMDEASQCTVQNGLPVMLRGRRVVVAGDEQQMPPTSFFESTGGDEEEVLVDEDGQATDVLDAESLLVLARGRVPRTGLKWHYRCLYEELIAFSNHSMYGGDLRTIPATVARSVSTAIRWVNVPDGSYANGANAIEARVVVDQMAELLRREKVPSIGVVTFNIQQRKVVYDEIEARRQSDPDFGQRYDTAMASERLDERPFVKNIEAVQGDERDVIVFSLGHAPVERRKKGSVGGTEVYVPARFGPLGQRGGERRLNVAVSRARRETVIVASFEPAQLSTSTATNDGPRLFRAFLDFTHHVAHGRQSQAERTLELVRSSRAPISRSVVSEGRFARHRVPLAVQIADALRAAGLQCDTDLGTSEFRIPLAMGQPGKSGHYGVAVLCDEGHQEHGAHERWVHVPGVLSARGWQHVRVTAREWHQNRALVLERLQRAARGE